MGSGNILIKRFKQHYGLDLKSNDLTRDERFASAMRNAQYKRSGAIEKRKGFQGASVSQGGHGLFEYNRISPSTGLETPELLAASDTLYKSLQSVLTVTYVGADPTALISIYFDTATSQYRCQILEGAAVVLDSALGIGFDEASPVTIDTLRAAIDALANFTATLTGATTTPAAFVETVLNHDLTIDPLAAVARYWSGVNKTVSAPFAGSETNKNAVDFENITSVQVQNVLYLANGYDYTQKYDGQTLYRAGLPDVVSLTTALGGAGAVTGTNYFHKAQYIQIDAVGNVVEGNVLQNATALNPVAQSINVTVANIQAASGFNTNCAVVVGAQVAVNTITVDDGSGGSHTIKSGDTAYFFDAVSAAYVERLVTAVAATTITIAGAAVTVADNAVISNNLRIALYRNETSGGSPTVFFLVAEVPNNSFAATQVHNDNLADASLGAQLIDPLTDRSAPPSGRYISAFRNQLVLAGNEDAPNTVFYSDVESPEYFPAGVTAFDVNSPSGDMITGIGANNEVFAVFQRKSIHVVSGDIAANNIRVDQVTHDLGCAAHATIKDIRGALFFMSDVGPRRMVGGQVPIALGESVDSPVSSRVDPAFEQFVQTDDERFVLKRATAAHDRAGEKYILYIPAESVESGDKYANAQYSRVYAYDYSRDAWLEWTALNMSGGAAFLGEDFFWVERRYSAFATAVTHVAYRRHSLDDAWAYQDNADAIDFSYSSQWEALGEPSVLKQFKQIRVFSLEDLRNNELMLTVKTELNYVHDVTHSEFDLEFSGGGYGISEYGDAAYGDPAESAKKYKLLNGRTRSLRVIFENDREQENVLITGWELECVAPFKPGFKT